MKKSIFLFSLVSFCAPFTQAQKLQFSMNDAVLGMRTNLATENLSNLKFSGADNAVEYVIDNALVRTSLPSLKKDTVFNVSTLNTLIAGTGSTKSLKKIPNITWSKVKTTQFSQLGSFNIGQEYFTISLFNNLWKVDKIATIPNNAENTTLNAQMNQIAYTIDNNLHVIDIYKKDNIVTNDQNVDIVNGVSVHRNEFGINGGIFFSPKGNFLAYYKMDQSMVANYPIIDWAGVPAKNKDIKYPMAGQTSHQVSLWVYNPVTKTNVKLEVEGPKEQYLTCVTWSPDEKSIFIAVLNRGQNHMQLRQYDAQTGKFVKQLFEEKDSKYVEPQNELVFLPNSNTEFLWFSQRSGYMHLYRYNTSGKLLNQVTKGDWLVNDIVGFNAKDNKVIVTTTKDSPKERHHYAVNYINGSISKIDAAPGMHSAQSSADGSYIIDVYSNQTTPKNIDVIGVNKKWSKNLLTAKDPLSNYERAIVNNVNLKAADGTDLYGKMILPSNFDSTKKYPVIVYLYNGPHLQLITNSYPASGNLWYEVMAQKGFIVFTMDGRGSSNRGLAFEQAVFRTLGTVEMEDQLQGVDYLKSLPYVDARRLGVHGWSFGGFMTTSLMLRHPGVFKVGVAGGPVIDWSLYEAMYTERYMDTPAENPNGYEDNNLLTKVKNLDGKLLMIHGAQDDVVVWQHSMKFIKAAVDNEKQLDYFVYPGHYHNVLGKDRVHLMQKITDYFVQNL